MSDYGGASRKRQMTVTDQSSFFLPRSASLDNASESSRFPSSSATKHQQQEFKRMTMKTPLPLSGLVICLSRIDADEKIRLHQMVESLGATFDRDLNASTTTHLVTPAPGIGAKYDMAVSLLSKLKQQSHDTVSLFRLAHIVTPQWIVDCVAARERLSEQKYSLVRITEAHGKQAEQDITEVSWIEQLKEILMDDGDRNKIFYSCRFLFVCRGLSDTNSKHHLHLEKLILRGSGTIFWELNETITHLLLLDGCDPAVLDAADVVAIHHPLGPAVVSPVWVLDSWKAGALCPLATQHRPQTRCEIIQNNLRGMKKIHPHPSHLDSVKKGHKSSLFRGSLFCLVRLSPPTGAIDFDANQLTADILAFGGQMLSSKVVEALRSDQNRDASTRRRTCFVVFWGGFSKAHISMHSLLAPVQKEKLCALEMVSPIWLKTSMADGSIPKSIRQLPLLFKPQPWPFLALHDSGIKLAVTGFVGAERSGLIQLIQTVGAVYTEHLKPSNTHLICKKDARGPKLEKALEWKLHVVGVDWLLHVVRYGYSGLRGQEAKTSATTTCTGCEAEFYLYPQHPLA